MNHQCNMIAQIPRAWMECDSLPDGCTLTRDITLEAFVTCLKHRERLGIVGEINLVGGSA